VYGRLQNKRLSVNVDASCAHSGKPIRFTLDTDLHVTTSEDTPGPMFCVPLIDTARSTARSILDIF
jgi:hypothetical protein